MGDKTAIVVGAGIVGLAMARSLAERGYSVSVFERDARAVGASIRNFGMIWPIGQTSGQMYERALLSKSIWKSVCHETGLWYGEKGSLHLACNSLELDVISEFCEMNRNTRPVKMLTPGMATACSEAVNNNELKGALWSGDEMIIDPREAINKLPGYLHEQYGVTFSFNTAISHVEYPVVSSGKNKWRADRIFICSGADFETLYPDVYAAADFTKCKLQMMKLEAQPQDWRTGPSLCGGLSLIHYKSFSAAPSLQKLHDYYRQTLPEYLSLGIHVMVSQNQAGELIIGDSHEYGLVHDPFNRDHISQLILDYLRRFAAFKSWKVIESWNGTYPKRLDGKTDFIFSPADGVTIVNGLGGAGMTLSFGLAEEVVAGR